MENLTRNKSCNIGLLLMRIGLGVMFMIHGFPKISGGPALWERVGQAMGTVGISFFPVFWGLAAALSEFLGGFLLITGIFFRPACGFLAFTMTIATVMLTSQKAGFVSISHPGELLIVFLGLLCIGPGEFRVRLPSGKKCGCRQ